MTAFSILVGVNMVSQVIEKMYSKLVGLQGATEWNINLLPANVENMVSSE
jgi:hypothetical protein